MSAQGSPAPDAQRAKWRSAAQSTLRRTLVVKARFSTRSCSENARTPRRTIVVQKQRHIVHWQNLQLQSRYKRRVNTVRGSFSFGHHLRQADPTHLSLRAHRRESISGPAIGERQQLLPESPMRRGWLGTTTRAIRGMARTVSTRLSVSTKGLWIFCIDVCVTGITPIAHRTTVTRSSLTNQVWR